MSLIRFCSLGNVLDPMRQPKIRLNQQPENNLSIRDVLQFENNFKKKNVFTFELNILPWVWPPRSNVVNLIFPIDNSSEAVNG